MTKAKPVRDVKWYRKKAVQPRDVSCVPETPPSLGRDRAGSDRRMSLPAGCLCLRLHAKGFVP